MQDIPSSNFAMKNTKSKSKNKRRKYRGKPISIPSKELKRRNVTDRILKIGLPDKYRNVMIDDTKNVLKYKKDKDRILKKKKEKFYKEQKERIKKMIQEEKKLQEFTRNGIIHVKKTLGKRGDIKDQGDESEKRIINLQNEIKEIKNELRKIKDIGRLEEYKRIIRSSSRTSGSRRLKSIQETNEINLARQELLKMPVKFKRDEQGRIFDINNNPINLSANDVSSVGANQEKFRNEKIKSMLKYRYTDLKNDYGEQVYDSNIKEAKSKKRRKTISGLGFAMSRNSRRPKKVGRVEDPGAMRHIRHTGKLSKYSIQKNMYKMKKLEGPVPDVEWWDEPLINFTTENYMTPFFIKKFKKKNQTKFKKDKTGKEMLFENWIGNDLELRLNLIEDLLEREDISKVVKDLDALNLLCKDNIKRLPKITEVGAVEELKEYQTRDEARRSKREKKLAAMKEIQEKIKYGLVPPPEPKLKLSNFMNILKEEAIQDPTKVELLVRKKIEQRNRKHEKHNQKRKAAKLSNKEKRRRKSIKDMNKKAFLSVYRIRDLSNFENQYKINVNAKKFFLKGFCIAPAKFLKDLFGVVIIIAGEKFTKKFDKLILQRIKWNKGKSLIIESQSDDQVEIEQEESDDEDFDFLDDDTKKEGKINKKINMLN
jgi:hypothetical protein